MADCIRITKIAGRYLLFDVKDVSTLRREHNICAVFVGTIPQAPTQNVFQGLPIELYAEEAKLLVEKGVAYVEDGASSHHDQLTSTDDTARQAYLQSLRRQRNVLQAEIDRDRAGKAKLGAMMKSKHLSIKKPTEPPSAEGSASLLDFGETPVTVMRSETTSRRTSVTTTEKDYQPPVHITPTTSNTLVPETPPDPASTTTLIPMPKAYPLYAHLNSKGYYIHPGIRFGADYSVYPGDPFRYHAHFMATNFGWNEEIRMLEIIGGGRLGTGVKKSFLIGGTVEDDEKVGDGDGDGDGEEVKVLGNNAPAVRTFTIEWAAI